MRPISQTVSQLGASTTSIAALTTLGAAGLIPQGGSLATGQGIANAQTLAAAGALNLNGSLSLNGSAVLPTPSRVNLQSAANLSAISFTVSGIIANGPDSTLNMGGYGSEVVTGPNNSIVTTLNTFAKVFGITANAAVGSNVTAYATAYLGAGKAAQVSLTSTNNLSAVNFTIYGFDANGLPRTEVLAGPNNNTVFSVNYWLYVTHVTTSAAATAVSVGNGGTTVGPWFVMDTQMAAFGVELQGVISGSPTWAVEYTNDDIFTLGATVTPFTHPTLTGQTANNTGNIAFPVRGIRGKVTAGGGSFTLTATQGMML